MANGFYPLGAQKLLNKEIDLNSDTLKVRLVKNTYSYSAAHEFASSIPAITGTTDQTLTTPTITNGVFDADDITWTAVNPSPAETASAIAVYKFVTNDADSPLLFLFNVITGFPLVTSGSDVPIRWSSGASRIFALPVAS